VSCFAVALLFFAGNSLAQDVDALQRTILSGTSEQKRDALYEIKKIATEPASRIAVPALRDPDVMVRSTAASAVVYLPAQEAVPLLHPLLSDKQEFVRREAAYALGSVGDAHATPLLIDRLLKDKIIEVRGAAAVALGQIGDPSAIEALAGILRKRPSDDTEFLRRSAARSIGQIAMSRQAGGTRTITPQNFLPAKFKELPASLADLTQARAEKVDFADDFRDALAVLSRVISSPSEALDVRREAAFAIGMIGNPASIGVLTKYSTDVDPYLAEICREALIKLQ
jgi:HEAT repeat protein